MERWHVGKATITKLVEFSSLVPPKYLLPGAGVHLKESPEDFKHYVKNGKLILSIHMLIVDIEEHRLAIDTCVGDCKKRNVPLWNNRNSEFDKKLIQHGFDPISFTHVITTHIHDDHVGWNCKLSPTGEWLPTFPNAKYIVTDKEYLYWTEQYTSNGAHGNYKAAMEDMELLNDSIYPLVKKGLLKRVSMSEQVVPGVALLPSPGHTPGHVCVHIQNNEQTCIITGDAFHHPVQIQHPNISATPVDTCSQQASQTRRQLLTQMSQSSLVIGTHFAEPSGGVVRMGTNGRYKFIPKPVNKCNPRL
eukprot:TRINITY_DN31801_c0_g1_i1.p1 TRINITY_DN31801_c0_g1~~TRINITY_DN31801_c0_g1_i1.p1  ORF type:complete len:304 (+),score=43.59 TRINITY_DN31801_c0_g1_i1:306-1217(+)